MSTRGSFGSEAGSQAALGVLLASFPGTVVPDWLAQAAGQGLGGVVLFGENTPDPEVARRLCGELHRLDPGLVVMIDEEGGDVTRLEALAGSSVPGQAALGVVDDVELTGRVAVALGAVLHAVGVDVDLAPSLDVASEAWNPVIGTRSFGAEADLVARHGAATVAAMSAAGVGACGKHYPGHGATTIDSHLGLPVLEGGLDRLRLRDLPPFDAAVAAGIDCVMTAHVVVPELGPGPASLEAWSTRMLRDSGFTGPVVTDALGMRAVGEDLGEAAVAALVAGADLLCLDAPQERDAETALRQARDAVVAAIGAGRLSVEQLQGSVRRNRLLGQRAAARRERPGPDLATALEQLQQVGAEAARRSLRVRGEVELTERVRDQAPLQLVDLRTGQNLAAGRTTTAFRSALERRLHQIGAPAPVTSSTEEDPHPSGPLLVLVREPHPSRPEGRALTELLSRRPDAVVVHTGVPATAPDVTHRVLCHGVGRANAEAVARCVLPTP